MTRTARRLLLASVGAIVLTSAIDRAWAFTPFGCHPGQKPGCSDDAGYLPPDAPAGPIAMCEGATMLAAAKLVKCMAKCKVVMVGSGGDDSTEETCEERCTNRFAKHASHLTGCPPCLSDPSDVALSVESIVDLDLLGVAYCKSPSGAFLDASETF